MPITLITGIPGDGKTLYLLSRLQHVHEAPPKGEARPVFHASGQSDPALRSEIHGIPDLKLPWTAFDPRKWGELPANAIAVIDEAQFVFPPRMGRGEPPEFVAELATHRHKGIDIYLVTQHPKLIDPFVARLVARHFHVRRKFGLAMATVFEFPSGVRDYPEKSNKDAIRHEWRYPKDIYHLYRSAEAHTIKPRLPMRVYVMFAMPLVFLGLAWLAWSRLNPDAQADRLREVTGQPPTASAPAAGDVPGEGPMRVPGKRERREGGVQWVSDFSPRVSGLPHTAPAYDHLTEPVEAPYPAYCVSLGGDYPCKCYTQRGTGLAVPLATCESIARDGFFAYWAAERVRTARADGGASRSPVSADPPASAVGG